MAKSITAAGGTTGRRMLLLALVAGIVAAILVYVALTRESGGSSEGASGAASVVPVVVAKQDIPARTKITSSMVEVRQIGLDDRSELAFTDLSDVVGRVTRVSIATKEQVLSAKVVALAGVAETGDTLSFIIPDGRRAISIGVSEVVSSGGLVLPGDYVDVIGVFDVEFRNAQGEKETQDKYFSRVILQNLEVLAVAQTLVDAPPEAGTATEEDSGATAESSGTQRARNTEADPEPKAATVTLSVTGQEAQLLFLAEENGVLRLAVRAYVDAEVQDIPFVVETELIPPDLPSPALR